MSDQRCLICKYKGDHSLKDLSRDRIYRERGGDLMLALCYFHSWELYLSGQRKFLLQYSENFMHFFGTETENELINYVKGIRKGADRWIA